MPHYYADVDPVLRNTSHTLVMEMIGTDKDVLDVGCASGYLAKALKERGNRVSGIEYMPEEAEAARPFLEKLVIADLTAISLVDEFGEGLFDAIVFADVLEHLPDPLETVRGAVPLLKPGGSIIISIPNVAHGAVRLGLLQGSWNYTYTGLLDATHLRFFTRKTLETMLSDAGLTVEELRGTVADPLQCEVQIDDETLPAGIVQWVREQPYAMTYQFVVRAVVGTRPRRGPNWSPPSRSPSSTTSTDSGRWSVPRFRPMPSQSATCSVPRRRPCTARTYGCVTRPRTPSKRSAPSRTSSR